MCNAQQPPEKVGGCFVPAVPEGSAGGLGADAAALQEDSGAEQNM